MSIVALQTAVAQRVAADVARLWGMHTPKGGHRAPRVGIGALPPKKDRPESLDPPDNPGQVSDDFPYVQILASRGSDGDEGPQQRGEATVHLAIGTYADDPEGATDVVLIIDLLRQSLEEQPLLEAPHDGTGRRDPRGAAGRYIAELRRLDWTVPVEQPRPFWVGTVTTVWTIPRPVRVDGVHAR